jgi:hypothetical protein
MTKNRIETPFAMACKKIQLCKPLIFNAIESNDFAVRKQRVFYGKTTCLLNESNVFTPSKQRVCQGKTIYFLLVTFQLENVTE